MYVFGSLTALAASAAKRNMRNVMRMGLGILTQHMGCLLLH